MVFLRTSVSRLARPAASSLLSARTAAPRFNASSILKQAGGARTLTATANRQGKVLMVLYDVSIFELAFIHVTVNIRPVPWATSLSSPRASSELGKTQPSLERARKSSA